MTRFNSRTQLTKVSSIGTNNTSLTTLFHQCYCVKYVHKESDLSSHSIAKFVNHFIKNPNVSSWIETKLFLTKTTWPIEKITEHLVVGDPIGVGYHPNLVTTPSLKMGENYKMTWHDNITFSFNKKCSNILIPKSAFELSEVESFAENLHLMRVFMEYIGLSQFLWKNVSKYNKNRMLFASYW